MILSRRTMGQRRPSGFFSSYRQKYFSVSAGAISCGDVLCGAANLWRRSLPPWQACSWLSLAVSAVLRRRRTLILLSFLRGCSQVISKLQRPAARLIFGMACCSRNPRSPPCCRNPFVSRNCHLRADTGLSVDDPVNRLPGNAKSLYACGPRTRTQRLKAIVAKRCDPGMDGVFFY